jgi:uncharacterized cupin superfamily protein
MTYDIASELAECDATVMNIDEMESIFGGILLRARAALGVTAWGMQVIELPPGFEHYPIHKHGDDAADPRQEEVYVPLRGSAMLELRDQRFELTPGVMARVGPNETRRLVPGPDGVRCLVIGGIPGEAFEPPAWTELGGPSPKP